MNQRSNLPPYSLLDFIKYKNKKANYELPHELEGYIVKPEEEEYRRLHQYNASINSVEIKGYLNTHIIKRSKNEDDDILQEKIQGLLNKLGENNFIEIANEIKELPYVKKRHIYLLSEKIVLKSISDISYSQVYAKLAQSLLPYCIIEQKKTAEGANVEDKILFRFALLTICQDIFEELSAVNTLNKDTKEVTKDIKQREYTRSTDYSKLSLSGLVKFLGELYNHSVVNDKIIRQCFYNIYELVLNKSDSPVYDALNILCQTVLTKLKGSDKISYNKMRDDLNKLINESNGFKFPKLMCKFKIREILEFYAKLG